MPDLLCRLEPFCCAEQEPVLLTQEQSPLLISLSLNQEQTPSCHRLRSVGAKPACRKHPVKAKMTNLGRGAGRRITQDMLLQNFWMGASVNASDGTDAPMGSISTIRR